MWRTSGKFPIRSSRLTSWRRGDRELAALWRGEWDGFVRNAGKDQPRRAVKQLLSTLQRLGRPSLPCAELLTVYVAKGPLEFQRYLAKLNPGNSGPFMASWPNYGIESYSLSGEPEDFVTPFMGPRWNHMNPGNWVARLWANHAFQSAVGRESGAGTYHVFPCLWDVASTLFAAAFLGNGIKLQTYQEPARLATALLDLMGSCFTVALSSTGAWAVIMRSPETVHVDEYGILHATTGPAVAWKDDLAVYSRRGVFLPADIFSGATPLTLDRISSEGNEEVRTLLIEHYGEGKYIEESGFALAASDERGELYKKEGMRSAFVKVKNASPDPDGTFRHFYLPVPRNFMTPTEAIGWTFRRDRGRYQPALES